MVERQLPKLNVAGSIPVSRSMASLLPDTLKQQLSCYNRAPYQLCN